MVRSALQLQGNAAIGCLQIVAGQDLLAAPLWLAVPPTPPHKSPETRARATSRAASSTPPASFVAAQRILSPARAAVFPLDWLDSARLIHRMGQR